MKQPDEPHDLLPAYVAGGLDPEAESRFRDHLEACIVCRGELEFMTAVRSGAERHGAEYFAEHPEVDDIVAFATGEEVGVADDRLRRHLGICASCAAEVSWVRGEANPAGSVADPSAPRRGRSGLWGWAAAAAAVLALAAVLGLQSGGDPLDSTAALVSTGFVQPAERAGGPGSVVEIDSNSRAVVLTIVVDLPGDAFPASIELLDATGEAIVEYDVASPAELEDGSFSSLTCGVKLCTPGSYSVRIASGTSHEHALPLQLVAAADRR